MSELKLLIKIPTRERPRRFFDVLNRAQRNRELTTTRFLITLDTNDPQMNCEPSKRVLNMWGNVQYHFGVSKNKVDAVNRDMDKAGDFDILLLLSDDMMPQVQGYDRIISEAFTKHFPDTDGIVWINDGHTGQRINTICCLGRKYFDRFNFIYNPVYSSLFCDNEYTDIAKKLNRYVYLDQVLIKHEHPMNTGRRQDSDNLYRRNDAYFFSDKRIYEERKDSIEKIVREQQETLNKTA